MPLKILKNLVTSLPIQLVAAIILAYTISGFFSLEVIQLFYAMSCVFKEIIMFVLPIVVFSYISVAILSLERNAPLLIVAIIAFVCVSNFVAVMTSYGASLVVLPFLTSGTLDALSQTGPTITPYFHFSLPAWIKTEHAMIAGVLYGFLFGVKRKPIMLEIPEKIKTGITWFLQKAFIPFLPLYVFGFVVKLDYEDVLETLFLNCGHVLIATCLLIVAYLFVWYFVAARGHLKQTWSYIVAMLPAGLTGFSTMSSAATMPVTLAAVEKNTGNSSFTQLIIPTSVNIHLVGDALGIPLLGMAVLVLSGQSAPDFSAFLLFAFYFCLAKFSTAGVPGGGVIVLLPILQSHMGLTDEMTSLVATLYILQDSIYTGSNVMANGAFALIVQKALRFMRLLKVPEPDKKNI